MTTTFVLGASGTVGSELSRLLEAAGHTVRRGTSRSAGPGQVHLDLLTGEGIDTALRGVDAAFLLSPPGHLDQDRLLAPVIDRARALGVRRVVLMTAMGADADPAGSLRKAELQLEASGVPWDVLRPNWFMQNFNSYWIAGIREAGAIRLPTGQARGSLIDARDIAAAAAALLLRPTASGAALDLTGPEAISHDEVAAILTEVTGRPIRYEDVAPAVMRTLLLEAGLPAPYAEMMLAILHFYSLGYSARVTDQVERLTGRAPRRFVDYARDYRAAFAPAA